MATKWRLILWYRPTNIHVSLCVQLQLDRAGSRIAAKIKLCLPIICVVPSLMDELRRLGPANDVSLILFNRLTKHDTSFGLLGRLVHHAYISASRMARRGEPLLNINRNGTEHALKNREWRWAQFVDMACTAPQEEQHGFHGGNKKSEKPSTTSRDYLLGHDPLRISRIHPQMSS